MHTVWLHKYNTFISYLKYENVERREKEFDVRSYTFIRLDTNIVIVNEIVLPDFQNTLIICYLFAIMRFMLKND